MKRSCCTCLGRGDVLALAPLNIDVAHWTGQFEQEENQSGIRVTEMAPALASPEETTVQVSNDMGESMQSAVDYVSCQLRSPRGSSKQQQQQTIAATARSTERRVGDRLGSQAWAQVHVCKYGDNPDR
jgi:hypothetical protein